MMSRNTERKLDFRDAIREALRQEMRRDAAVILIGEDLAGGATHAHAESEDQYGGVFGVTRGLVEEFGRERVLDTPISEAAFVGTGVGAAATGMRPVVELMFASFFGVAADQIFNQGAKLRYMTGGKARIPMVIRTAMGAGFGAAAQHSECNYSAFTHFPGVKTVIPSTPYDAKGLLISAIRDDDLVVFFEHMGLYDLKGPVPEEPYTIPLGQADVKRAGEDVTIVAVGKMVHHALEAAERLFQKGISAEVVDLRSLMPLDEDAVLDSFQKTHRLMVVDEDYPRCSIANDLAALAVTKGFLYLNAPIQLVTPPHTPVPFSPVLEQRYLPNAERIVAAAEQMF
jgi:pyruvate dehydrogenase E1 component beta subunit